MTLPPMDLDGLPGAMRLRDQLEGASNDMICRITPAGLIDYLSPATAGLTGYLPEDLLGTPIFHLFSEIEQAPYIEAGEDAVWILGMVHCKNGADIWVEGSVTLVRDDDQKEICELVAVLRGIDSRFEAEKRLQESERRFLYLFESNVLAMCSWSRGFWVSDANAAFLDMTGFLGAEVSRGVICLRENKVLGLEERAIKEVLQRGVCTPFEAEFTRVDGARFSVMLGAARMDDVGDTGVLFALDITDRKRKEVVHAQLAAIVESSEDAILGLSLDGIVQSWNSGATHMYGYSREEMVGQPVTRIEVADDAGTIFKIIHRMIGGVRIERFDSTRRCKNGSLIHVSETLSPIIAPDGEIVGASSIARDITEYKIMESFREGQMQLWKRVGEKQRLPDVLDALAGLLRRLTLGTAVDILLVADTGAILHRGGAAGLSPEFLEAIDCTDIQCEGPSCARAVYSRRSVTVVESGDEVIWRGRARTESGARLRACYSVPIVALGGMPLGTIDMFFIEKRMPTPIEERLVELSVEMVRGILEQHAADVEAARAREQSRLILDTLDEVAFTYQTDKNRFLYLSAAAEVTFGHSVAEIEARPQLLSGLSSYAPRKLIELLVHRLQGNRAGVIEYRITTPRGENKWLQCRVQLSSNVNGDIAQIHGIIRDVTSQKALEAELQAKSKMAVVGLLAAGVAHEIGNPLAFLSARLQRLSAKTTPAFTLESIEQMKSQVDRITTTLRKVSGFSRSEAQVWTACNVGDMVRETIDILRLSGGHAPVEVVSEIDPHLPLVSLVREQLHQVFVNLGLNAFDAMPRGGRLVIRARMEQGDLAVRFTDTGVGIPSDIQSRIFDPGFSTKGGGRNMGLGLYLSLTFVKSHGGTIVCHSEEGRGTTFAVQLPILKRLARP